MKKMIVHAATVLATVIATTCLAATPGFDFAYEIGGSRKVAPLQVFDDGAKTYIAWPTALSVPSVRVLVDGKAVSPLGGLTPYFVVAAVGDAIEIRDRDNANLVARATYVGERGRAPMQVAEAAKPAIAAERAARVAAVRGSEITHWEISDTDRTLQATFARWAKASGYTLRWGVLDTITIDRGAVYKGPLNTVLSQIAKDMALTIAITGAVIHVTDNE
jgi:hypothetical protein